MEKETNQRALIGKDKRKVLLEYSTIEICRNRGTSVLSGEKWKNLDDFWHFLDPRIGFEVFWKEELYSFWDAGIPIYF